MADETADNPLCHDPGHADIVSVLATVAGERDDARAEARKAQKRLDSITSDPADDALRAWPVGSPQWKVIRAATRWRLARGDRSMSGGEFVRICRELVEAVDGLPDAIDHTNPAKVGHDA